MGETHHHRSLEVARGGLQSAELARTLRGRAGPSPSLSRLGCLGTVLLHPGPLQHTAASDTVLLGGWIKPAEPQTPYWTLQCPAHIVGGPLSGCW